MDVPSDHPDLTTIVAEIVSAYVSNNSIAQGDLPGLIGDVHRALAGTAGPAAAEPGQEQARPKPAEVRRSITPDFLISFEDGKRYKSLKRHLATRGLSPQQYREKWGLPADYPMVAPNYSAQRSALARSLGLGRKAGPGLAKVSPEDALRVEAFEEAAENPAGEAPQDDPALAAVIAAGEEPEADQAAKRPRRPRGKRDEPAAA